MSNFSKGILVVIVLVLLVLGLSFWAKSSMPTEPVGEMGTIKLGVIAPLTGDAAALGEFVKNVTDLAVEEINNAGGIDGRMLELVYEDDKCTGKDGATAAQKLINVNKTKIIIGSSCSGGILAAMPIAEQNKVFIISGTATSPDLTNKSLFFARTIPGDLGQGKVLAETAIARGWKKVAVLQETSDYALGIFRAFEGSYPVTVGTIVKEEYPGTTTDFRSTLAKLKATNPDALFIDPQSPGTAERILRQLSDLQWNVPLMANDVIGGNTDLLTAYSVLLEGALVAEQGIGDTSKSQKLEQDYIAKFGKEMIYRAYAQAQYDLMYLVAEGLGEVGEDPEGIANWIRTVKDWPGASGMVTIGADGDRVGGHVLKVIKEGKVELVPAA